MPLLYRTAGTPGYGIYGDPDQPGEWSCSCPKGSDHHKRVAGTKPHVCKHLDRLFRGAKSGALDTSYFRPTAAGRRKAAACACNGGPAAPLALVAGSTDVPATGPAPGEPSRNKPCPCGSGTIFKWCHGNTSGPPAGAPPMPKPKKSKAPQVDPELRRAIRAETRRTERIERGERAAIAIERARAADELRRERRRARDAAKRAAKAIGVP